MSVSDPSALARYNDKGLQLTFGDDFMLSNAVEWEFDYGLEYIEVKYSFRTVSNALQGTITKHILYRLTVEP